MVYTNHALNPYVFSIFLVIKKLLFIVFISDVFLYYIYSYQLPFIVDKPDVEDVSEKQKKKVDWRDSYKKALEARGSVRVKIVRCFFIGPSGAGKSCCKRLLVHNESKEITTSTGLAETPEIVMISPISDQGPPHQPEGLPLRPEPVTEERYFHNNQKWILYSDSLIEKCVRTAAKRSQFDENRSYLPLPKDPHPLPNDASKPGKSSIVTEFSQHRDQLLQNQEETDLVNLKEATMVHFLDSGGQPAFHDALPFLFTLPCNYLLTFNASEDINQLADITFRPKEQQCQRLPDTHRMTTMNMILKCLSSIHVASLKPINPKLESVVAKIPQLNILLVGTNKDKLMASERKEEILENHRSLSVLKDKPYFDRFILNDPKHVREITGEKLLHLIDNMMLRSGKADPADESALNYLRSKITESPESVLELDMPLMWYLLDVITSRSKNKFVRYDEFQAFCIESGYIDIEDADGQFQAMLELFSMLGMYVHFALKGRSMEDNWICTDVTTILKELGKILCIQFHEPEAGIVEKFKQEGMIRKNFALLFKKLDIAIPESCYKWLLDLLHHIGLAAQVHPNSQEYFMPSVLPYGRVDVPDCRVVQNLCFAFSIQQDSNSLASQELLDIPNGIFCRLVVALADCNSHELSLKPNLKRENSDRTTIRFIWNDRREFDLYLMEKPSHIELSLLCSQYFHPYDPASRLAELHKCCSEIRSAMFKSLKKVCQIMFGERLVPTVGFSCTCDPGKPHLAPARPSDDHFLMCTKDKRRYYTPSMKIWAVPVNEHHHIKWETVNNNNDLFWVLQDNVMPELSRQIPSEGSQMVAPQSPPTGSEAGTIAIAQSQQENQSRKTPKEIRVFLNGSFYDQMGNADVREVAADLVAGRVIDSNKLESIGPNVDQQKANTNLFEVLLNDPSERKLRVLSCSLKRNRTHDNNQELSRRIDQFLGN